MKKTRFSCYSKWRTFNFCDYYFLNIAFTQSLTSFVLLYFSAWQAVQFDKL